MASARNSLAVTWSVLRALMLREAVSRLFARRGAWAWVLLEPLLHVVFLAFMFTVLRQRSVGGMDTVIWLLAGVLPFFLFRQTFTQGLKAINLNQALFAYRQVKPVDTVIARCLLEAFLLLLIAVLAFGGAALFGIAAWPDNPLLVIQALLSLWLLGVGWALMVSIWAVLIPEMSEIAGIVVTPIYLLSGVIFPLAQIPYPYREWLLINAVAHGVEAVRLGFSSYYHAIPELSLAYLHGCALAVLFLGLAFQVRFARRAIEQ